MAPTKTRQAYSEDDLQRAVNAVEEDFITFAVAEQIYRVPRGTKLSYVKNRNRDLTQY